MDTTESKDDKSELELNKPFNICRCCLAEGCYKDISTNYYWLGELEVYENILKDTFNVCISYQNIRDSVSNSRLICERCIVKLREASSFKKQILETEKNFAQYLEALYNSKAEVNLDVNIKNEVNDNLLDGDVANDDCDDSMELLGNDRLTDVKSEDDDSDFDLATIKKMTKGKKTNKKPVKRKSKTKDADEPPASKKKKKKGRKRTEDSIQMELMQNYNGNDDEKKKVKENALTLVLNSNMCLFKYNKTKFKCFVCDNTFVSMEELRSHMGSDHTAKDISWRIKTLKMINLKKVDISNLECKICNELCDNIVSLKLHLFAVHDIEFHDVSKDIFVPYQLSGSQMNDLTCSLCHSKFKAFNKLSIHMNTHFQFNVCDLCGIGFSNLSGLKQHKRNVHRDIHCKICGHIFNSSSKMQRHRIKEHKVIPRRKCPFCDAVFRYSEQLYLHKIEAHGFERTQYKCIYCDKIFIIEYSLKAHVKAAHFKPKKHPCIKCDMVFKSNYELTRHLNTTHVTEKNVACNLCNAKYKCVSSLRRHMKSAVHRRL